MWNSHHLALCAWTLYSVVAYWAEFQSPRVRSVCFVADWEISERGGQASTSIILLCPRGFNASSTKTIRLHVLATPITCLPLPLPSLAPSMIPGRSSNFASKDILPKGSRKLVQEERKYEIKAHLQFGTLVLDNTCADKDFLEKEWPILSGTAGYPEYKLGWWIHRRRSGTRYPWV